LEAQLRNPERLKLRREDSRKVWQHDRPEEVRSQGRTQLLRLLQQPILDRQFISNRCVLFAVWEAGKAKIKVLTGLASSEGRSLSQIWGFLAASSLGGLKSFL
jgi:hypothetical protein